MSVVQMGDNQQSGSPAGSSQASGSTRPVQDSAVGKISLCLSGGGFRAVGFHLGAVEYLDHVGLLGNVNRISTVSGGTFVGATWIVSLLEDKRFDDYFREYFTFNETADLMSLAFANLRAGRPGTPSGRNSLIVSMAEVHANTIMRSPEGGSYRFETILDADLPLDEIVFNTTELRNGLAFAFRKSTDPDAIIGNPELRISREDAADARMADIVTASSCFPGGFESLAFPDDFVWRDKEPPTELRHQFSSDGKPHPVGFVDGCVYDNQGIETLLIDGAMHGEDTDMAIISDTDQRFNEIYPIPAATEYHNQLRLGQVLRIMQFVAVLVVLGTAAIGTHLYLAYTNHTLRISDAVLYAIPLIFGGVISFGLLWGYFTVRRVASASIPAVGRSIWKGLKGARMYDLLEMVGLRMTLLMAINEKFNPKRIRELVYEVVYNMPVYKGKLVSNRIFELAPGEPWAHELPAGIAQPSRELHRVADVAAKLGTNLWFDHPYELPCLVAAGQATLCYNLMIWVVRRHGAEPSQYKKDVRKLWDRLNSDWTALCANPYALLEERLPDRSFERPPR